MIINKFFKLVLFIFFIAVFNNSIANAKKGRADVFKVTMQSLELCSDSRCSTPLLVCNSTNTVDIASVDAGNAIGKWCSLSGLEMGKTYSHYRVKLHRTFTLKGTVENVSGTTDCITQSGSSNAGTKTQLGFGKQSGTAEEQDLVIVTGDGSTEITTQSGGTTTLEHSQLDSSRPIGSVSWCIGLADGLATTVCTAANTTGSATWANQASADHMLMIYPFASEWTTGPVSPKMTLHFNTSQSLEASVNGGECDLNPSSPTVTVSVN